MKKKIIMKEKSILKIVYFDENEIDLNVHHNVDVTISIINYSM